MIGYEVWALCCDENYNAIDGEEFLGEFTDKAAAIEHAKKFKKVDDIYDAEIKSYFIDEGGKYMHICVEETDWDTSEVVDYVYEDWIE